MDLYTIGLVALTILPAIFLVIRVYRMDKIEREPIGLILLLIGSGILYARVAGMLNGTGKYLLQKWIGEDSGWYPWIYYIFVVGFVEEGGKLFFLRRITWRNKNFNYHFDAIVYAAAVSAGFAIMENISYVFKLSGGYYTSLMRAITAIPAHLAFSVFMGIFYAKAKEHRVQGHRLKADACMLLALVIPQMIHGLYDVACSKEHLWQYILADASIMTVYGALIFLTRKKSWEDGEI